jgi:hypothetical protein
VSSRRPLGNGLLGPSAPPAPATSAAGELSEFYVHRGSEVNHREEAGTVDHFLLELANQVEVDPRSSGECGLREASPTTFFRQGARQACPPAGFFLARGPSPHRDR